MVFCSCTSLTNIAVPDSVTSIGASAFASCSSLTTAAIGNGVTTIPSSAFYYCTDLTSVTIPNSVTYIGDEAFFGCARLSDIAIPSSVSSIGAGAFELCTSLSRITIPSRVTNLANLAFAYCSRLKGVYFSGNAPSLGGSGVFSGATNATVYYLPGTTGWGSTLGGRRTARWLPQVQTSDGNFGVRTNQFGFNITWASGMVVVVEACADLANPTWIPVSTNTLTDGTSNFSDANWTNYPARFYRLRSP
jgi:hypothetical protein